MAKGVLLPRPWPEQDPDTLSQVLLHPDGHFFLHFSPYSPSLQSFEQCLPCVPFGHTLKIKYFIEKLSIKKLITVI